MIGRAFLLVAVLGAVGVPGAHAADPAPAARVFVEIVVPKTEVFVHEPFVVQIRFGVDRDFFAAHAAQLFRTELDVPLALTVPWFDTLPGSTPRPTGERHQFVLNTKPAVARTLEDRMIDGRAYSVFQIERRARASAVGPITLAAPTLRFAHATRFEEDFVGGRVPIDRKDVSVPGAPRTIQVTALPTAGRPPMFVDAVGYFEVRASASRTKLDEGEPFSLTLRIEGEGNLATLTPPALRALPGLHRYGVTDDRGATVRTLTFELAALRADVREVPAIAFAFFDPGPPSGFVTVHTQPIPLEVEAVAGGTPREHTTPPDTAAPDGPGASWLWWLVPLLVLALVAFFVARRRRRAAVPEAAPQRPVRDATRIASTAQALRVCPPEASSQGFAFTDWLAAQLGCAPAAVVAPDLAQRVVRAGIDADLAHRTAHAVEALVAARYGGAKDVRLDTALSSALEDAFSN